MISTIADTSFLVPTGTNSSYQAQNHNQTRSPAIHGSSVSNQQGNVLAAGGNISPSTDVSGSSSDVANSNEQLDKVITEYVKKAQSISRDLEFKIDKELGQTVITVYDSETDEVVRQIPAEEVLQLARSFKHMSEGLLLKAQA